MAIPRHESQPGWHAVDISELGERQSRMKPKWWMALILKDSQERAGHGFAKSVDKAPTSHTFQRVHTHIHRFQFVCQHF
jgi:hypothetical protein